MSELGKDVISPQTLPTINIDEALEGTPESKEVYDNQILQIQPQQQRRPSVQSKFRRPSKTPTVNTVPPGKEKTPTMSFPSAKPGKWQVKLSILHPLDPKPIHSVDIVVVYLYHGASQSEKFAVGGDHWDQDLAVFQCVVERKLDEQLDTTSAGAKQRNSSPEQKLGRWADVVAGKSSSSTIKDFTRTAVLLGPNQIRSSKDGFLVPGKPLPMKVNWLKDTDMLPSLVPEARIIGVGFDIRTMVDTPFDFEAAATQLYNNLTTQRADCPNRPLLFIGHAFGGTIIEQALVNGAREEADTNAKTLLERAAGVVLISCPIVGLDERTKMIASLYNMPVNSKFFDDLGTGSVKLSKLTEDFNKTIMQKDIPKKPYSNDTAKDQDQKRKSNTHVSGRTSFPIIILATEEEVQSQEKTDRVTEIPKLDRVMDRLDDPAAVLVLSKSFYEGARFSDPKDNDFQRVAQLILWAVQTRQLLDAATDDGKDMDLLIEQGVNVNLRDRWGRTALHIASKTGNEPMVRLLLRTSPADPNLQDVFLNTPLHYAVENNNLTIVQYLLDSGADISIENELKETPEDLANQRRSRRRIANLLRQQPRDLVTGPVEEFKLSPDGPPLPPDSPEGRHACKSFQVTATEMFSLDGTDQHWSIPVSIQEMIYGRSSVDKILDQVRPKDVAGKKPVCRWFHIHANNMIWVEHLFAKMQLGGSIWAGRGHASPIPHNRAITPHVATTDSQDQGSSTLAIFVPYLSYEVHLRQKEMSEFITDTYKGFIRQDLRWNALEYYGIPRGVENGYEDKLTSRRSSTSSEQSSDSVIHRFRSTATSLRASQTATVDERMAETLDLDAVTESEPEIDGAEYELDGEDKSLIKAYLNHPPALHVRRTLDQYYYHMLKDTEQRDNDQVVARWATRDDKDAIHNILMVDQLWLWIVRAKDKPDIIISSFPDRTGVNPRLSRNMDNLHDLVLKPTEYKRKAILNTHHLANRIVATCFNIFDRSQEVEMLQFLQVFEGSIGQINDQESKLFKRFRNRSEKLHTLSRKYKNYEKKKSHLLEQMLDIQEETQLLVDIKDIRDEINIILTILRTQQTLVSDPALKKFAWDLNRKKDAFCHCDEAKRIISTSTADFTKMESQAKAVQNNLNALMDLKQKAANAWEARYTREGAVETARQGNTMLVFTVVTIIFLPLSFMSSFFAIGIAQFPQDDKGNTNWPLHVVSGYLFGISFAVAIPFIILAFSVQSMTTIWSNMANDRLIGIALWFLKVGPLLHNQRLKCWRQKLKARQHAYTKEHYEPKKEEDEEDEDVDIDPDIDNASRKNFMKKSASRSSYRFRFSGSQRSTLGLLEDVQDSDNDKIRPGVSIPFTRLRLRRRPRLVGDEEQMEK